MPFRPAARAAYWSTALVALACLFPGPCHCAPAAKWVGFAQGISQCIAPDQPVEQACQLNVASFMDFMMSLAFGQPISQVRSAYTSRCHTCRLITPSTCVPHAKKPATRKRSKLSSGERGTQLSSISPPGCRPEGKLVWATPTPQHHTRIPHFSGPESGHVWQQALCRC